MSDKERGPVYGVELVDTLPIGGILQQMPSRQDLEYVRQFSERTVAGYEVLLALAQRMAQALQDVEELIAASGGVYGLHRNGDNSPWDELFAGGEYEDWLSQYSAVDQAAIAMLLSDEDDGMSDDKERKQKAIAGLYAAAEAVVERHDNGTLAMVHGDSSSIEALRRAVVEARFAKVMEEER